MDAKTDGPHAQVVEGCPAFTQGCPFADDATNLSAMKIIQSLGETKIASLCPAFTDGCCFKDSDSVESLYVRLSEMPSSHQVGADTQAAEVVKQTLQMIHRQSSILKAKLDKTCPVFATSCPFKTVTSEGKPLVQELDSVIFDWNVSDEISTRSDNALSKCLKSGTKTVHRAAENVQFVRDFLRGAVPRESYVELLKALHHVYGTLEPLLRALPVRLKHCDFDVVARTGELSKDLRYFMDLGESEELDLGTPSQCAKIYVDRLISIAKQDPVLLLAHAYTRYLGDLSGGQILARAAAKAFDLPSGRGSAFYHFALDATAIKQFKREYRASLDTLCLPRARADALVAEAQTAFLLNMLLFEERDVAAGHLQQVRSLREIQQLVDTSSSALKFQQNYVNAPESRMRGQTRDTSACPFLVASESRVVRPKGACPWPFIWFHDPLAALRKHVGKNLSILSFIGLCIAMCRRYRRLRST